MLDAMTTFAHDPLLSPVLSLYAEYPLDDGDAVLLLDDAVAMEVAGLADHWDGELRARITELLARTARSVTLAIARPRSGLLDSDYQVWRDLHADLRHTDIDLAPVRALPAT